jgi:aminotransferase in exopolysaccharide biosynthesis
MKSKYDLPSQILSVLKNTFGSGPVALHEPSFEGNELRYLKDCIESTFVSSSGKFIDKFELDLANYTGAKYAIAVVNGTAALQISLQLSGVQAGDEVLIPALTFVATANAVLYCNAIPHFLASEEDTLGIDPDTLREYLKSISVLESNKCVNRFTGRTIRAIVPMHTFGHPSRIEELCSVAEEFNLTLIEDAAESIGSRYNGKHTGTFGLFGTLSFNGNKTITTGGGGAILTNDYGLAKSAKHLITTAKVPHRWEFRHDKIGYNYRMPNLNAALGCAQLEQLDKKLEAKRNLYVMYSEIFKDLKGVTLFCEPKKCKSNYWLQTLLLEDEFVPERDNILKKLNSIGIMVRPAWNLLNELDPFVEFPHMELTKTRSIQSRIINLPSSPSLELNQSNHE